jgi:membrane associated rhomboid family serine protease
MIPLKDDTPSALKPYVTVSLIAACCAVFLWQSSLDLNQSRRVVAALGAIPAVLLTDARLPIDLQWIPRYCSPLTSMFLHGGWLHLLGNMLFLWIYGDNVEDCMGHARYFLFYVLCGTAAICAQALSQPHSAYPIIGASGAISGVLGAYLLLFPRAKVLTLVLLPFFFTTLRLPAMLLLLLWFAVQLVSDLAVHGGGSSVAFRAHIGGFLAGMLLVPLFKRRDVSLFAPTAAP